MGLIKRLFCNHELWIIGVVNGTHIVCYCQQCGLRREMRIKNMDIIKGFSR